MRSEQTYGYRSRSETDWKPEEERVSIVSVVCEENEAEKDWPDGVKMMASEVEKQPCLRKKN